jgi:excisionase family DNA binding protein
MARQNERVSLTVREAARISGFGIQAMYRGVRDGIVPHIKLGRRIVIPRAALNRWLETAGDFDKRFVA